MVSWGMIRFFKKVLAFSIVLLAAAAVLWPFWPSWQHRDFFLFMSIRLLLILAAVYGTLAFAEFIHDRWKSRML